MEPTWIRPPIDDYTYILGREHFASNLTEIISQGHHFFPGEFIDGVFDFRKQREASAQIYDDSHPLASGVFVAHDNRNYFVTASHVIEDDETGEISYQNLVAHSQGTELRLGDTDLLYCSSYASQNQLLSLDVAVFEYSGQFTSVEIGKLPDGESPMAYSFSFPSHPGLFFDWWKENTTPLFGAGYLELLKPNDDNRETHVKYTGPTLFGSSGGGIYDLSGNLIAVHQSQARSPLVKPVFELIS